MKWYYWKKIYFQALDRKDAKRRLSYISSLVIYRDLIEIIKGVNISNLLKFKESRDTTFYIKRIM